MKLFLFLTAILLTTVSIALTNEDVDTAWNNFKVNFGKNYRSLEENFRKEIFTKNFNFIVNHNKLYEQGLVSYTVKVNKFADMTVEEFTKTSKGARRGNKPSEDIEVKEFVPDENLTIPDEFDWREKGAVTPIKDQKQCGSCWTFSTTGSLEGQYFLKTGELVSLSEQNIIDCSHEHNNKGCDGGDMNPAFTYIFTNEGIDSEESYPYEGVDAECRYKASGKVTSVIGYTTIELGNEEYLKAAVATIGPISVGIDASNDSFRFYDSGVYYEEACTSGTDEPEYQLDHDVLAIGYGSENGEDYWLVKNSWGTTWGDEGFIKMARNRNNNCGIASYASFPLL